MATLFDTPIQLFPLRPRQKAAIDGIRQAIREGHKRIILQAPCRSGKTVMSAHIIAGALAKGNYPLFAVPRISLIGQTLKRFESQGIIDVGVIQADHPRTNVNAAVQVASVQTLVMRPLPEVDVVIIDEIHIQHQKLDAILDSDAWKNKIVIGLSATPWRKGMGRRWTALVEFGRTTELIDEGWLCPVVAYGVPDGFTPDRSKLHTASTGDFVESEAETEMSKQVIVGHVVKTWLEHGPSGTGEHTGDRTFMFCVNRTHARLMQKEFEDAGVSCGYIDGTMDAEQRERIFKKYRSGEYKIIASIDTIGTGIDEDVRCIIYVRLTKSEIRWVQDGSRGMTPFDGKEFTLLLDHCGTCEELGLFVDIHYDTLDMHDPKEKGQPFSDKKAPKPNKCPKCNAIVRRGFLVCPICHHKFPAKSPRHVDGELVKLDGGRKQKKGQREYTMQEKQDWYSGLLYIAQQRGNLEGVAAHRFRDKFGAFPRGLHKTPTPPAFEVSQFDKHCRIRWAKSKQKAEREVVNA